MGYLARLISTRATLGRHIQSSLGWLITGADPDGKRHGMPNTSQPMAKHVVPALTPARIETDSLSVDACRAIAAGAVLVCSRSRRLNGAAEETSPLDANIGSLAASSCRQFGRKDLRQDMRRDGYDALLRQIGQVRPDMARVALGESF